MRRIFHRIFISFLIFRNKFLFLNVRILASYLRIRKNSTDIDKSKDKSLLKNSNSTTIVEKLKTNLCQGIISDKCEDVYSMDLQKILLLPILPESKTRFFTSRLVVFNVTFASLKSKRNSICVLWHKVIARKKGEILYCILALIKQERDVIDFIFWCDNCTESGTIKYLTKGHTHMSANGIHRNIETKIRKIRNIYDYDELKNTIKASRKNGPKNKS
ncbi:Uncharacterized protein FWK35_00000425 [Aphis craccivora]|uniref:Uncharacterized protein n=1 Tax=Aphis craccivora TaxID=307492 RepID=A0A6G0ZE10_APHCR|nr:Uncharacterized protein FWK35_00000425 [Aphis craccivora]